VDGVQRTATHIAFRSYSSLDADSGFEVGE